jgi:transcriptional repressor NrdR
MKCPYCDAPDTRVIDSRHLPGENKVRRRRKCDVCQERFTTYESLVVTMPMVAKSDGRIENYNREKLESGILKACQKRPISTTQIEAIIDDVEKNIQDYRDKEISSKTIGGLVMEHLRNLDPVAYVRFASVYFNYKDIAEFVRNLQPRPSEDTPYNNQQFEGQINEH